MAGLLRFGIFYCWRLSLRVRVVTVTREVYAALTFASLGLDCDNGSEFLNHHLTPAGLVCSFTGP